MTGLPARADFEPGFTNGAEVRTLYKLNNRAVSRSGGQTDFGGEKSEGRVIANRKVGRSLALRFDFVMIKDSCSGDIEFGGSQSC